MRGFLNGAQFGARGLEEQYGVVSVNRRIEHARVAAAVV
jgi:hypothetical protein